VRTFHNTYEQAKAEAEALAFASDLRVTVHRPSMVVGDSRTGRVIRRQVFYHLCEFLSGRRSLGFVPQTKGFRLDIVPVDFVARAIDWSSRHLSGGVLHLCSGPSKSLDLDDLQRIVRARSLVRVPRRVFRALLPALGRFLPLRGLDLFLEYLEERQAFDNRETVRVLGVEPPPPREYLGVVLGQGRLSARRSHEARRPSHSCRDGRGRRLEGSGVGVL
jgi:thioester reductase-like protein